MLAAAVAADSANPRTLPAFARARAALLSFVTVDIDSETRSTTKPYRGADEVPNHPL